MRDPERDPRVMDRLAGLARLSFVAHRDACAVLPAIFPLGADAVLQWLDACETVFMHDRDAGKAFIHGSAKAVRAFGGLDPWCRVTRRFCTYRGSGRALEAYIQQLPSVAAAFGAGTERWAEIGLSWCARHADSGRAYFETGPTELAGSGGIDALEPLLAPAKVLYEESGLGLGRYLAGALRVRALLGERALASWARCGGDILKSGRVRGEAFFGFESEESRMLLLEHLPGFRPFAHERLLALLFVTWFGEVFLLEQSTWMPGAGRPFIETDGRSLLLPAAFGDREEALLSVWHAAGHLVFGTFDPRAVRHLFDTAGVHHPALEPDQAVSWQSLLASYGDDQTRFQVLFDLCEDLRIDARVAARIPRYLERLLALCARHSPRSAIRPYWDLASASWRALVGHGVVEERLRSLTVPGATVSDAYAVARELYREGSFPVLTPGERAEAYPPAHGPHATRPVYLRRHVDGGAQDEVVTDDGGLTGERVAETATHTPKDARGSDPDLEIPLEDTAGAGGRVGVGLPQPARVSGRPRGRGHSEVGSPYPEWDYRERHFRRRWAWVQERPLEESDPAEAGRILVACQPTLQRLKCAIEAQKPTRLAPRTRQLDGDDLHMEAAVNFVAERRAGLSPRPAIYRHRRPQQRDLAVLLLADVSTSIMQRLPDGGRIVDRIRAALLLFAESLEEVGDPYAIAGFASKYRDCVRYYPIKEFDEPLNMRARGLIGGLTGRLATRMGAAIRHAAVRFGRVSASRRLLLLLSDGRPADYDDGGDSRYLEQDTRVAIKGCVDRGIHPFCITLDPRGGDYLKRIFGAGHYLVIGRLDELPARLPEVYLRLRGT